MTVGRDDTVGWCFTGSKAVLSRTGPSAVSKLSAPLMPPLTPTKEPALSALSHPGRIRMTWPPNSMSTVLPSTALSNSTVMPIISTAEVLVKADLAYSPSTTLNSVLERSMEPWPATLPTFNDSSPPKCQTEQSTEGFLRQAYQVANVARSLC
jgi:hypothetical protein